ncbi:hypothetical protein Aau02nite_27640 [Amorphoplanes auranticolor]|uniref:Uncharacterized protein n=2 Tax=Actinoplanes auranticolor TaxID=47988 RepID=A0A919S8J0_9ACTN|nr:hypothetical protein Aau02nite_27640 [Actinoplanes auranticolor]
MQFLAQISLADVEAGAAGLLSIFMCQNDPGLCDEWDPTSGAHRAFGFGPDAGEIATPPDEGITLLDETCAIRLEEGHNHRTAANFGGGGCAYGYRCRQCNTAAFLWQR